MVFGTFGNQKVKTPNNLIGLCIVVWWVMYLFFSVLLENWGLCFTFELVSCVVVYRALALENSNSTLFYHSKKSFYHYTIPFYNTSSIPKLYFY